MSTLARGQSGLPGWLGLLAWLVVGLLINVAGAQAAETVWVDDATPTGASLYSDGGDQWTWITGNPAPYSGTQAHQSVAIAGEHQHYFMGTPASGQLGINVGDKLFAYVYLDPANPPSEIMLQWHDTTNSWDHRAYWGSNNIPWGTDGTVSRLYMGVLPAAGQWVRLEVPARQVGLEGSTLDGMAFTLFNGRATWDRAGKADSSTLAPSVSLTAPTSGATYTAPANITLSATAAETGGTISKVEFYNGTTLLGTATAAPYTVTLANVTAGSYTYTAKAYDSAGTSTTSTAVTITVNAASAAPSVSLTAPTNNQTYAAPASITLNATATESGGTISRVDFYSGASLLGAATAAPYTYTWSNVPAGSYTFTAVATDTNNVSTTSSPVSVSVGAVVASQIYYIYTDQLDTPRLITDSANSVVWRNDQADPFNASAPYDDPGNTGHHFVFNLRFPGQYYDQETGLAYNYFRDYDANTGRYVQSDPIGLAGGMNTYSYVGGNPVSYADPMGLSGEAPYVILGKAYGGVIAYGVGMVTGNEALKNSAAEGLACSKADNVDVLGMMLGVRNARLAGGVHPKTGIPFDGAGYPDFSRVAKAQVEITQTGSRAGDFRAANEAAGLASTPEGYTWHHHQDGVTMQLVPRDVHAQTGHTGGYQPGP